MNTTLKRVLILTFFVISILTLTVLGASAATGYVDDAAAIDAEMVARVGEEGTDTEYFATLEEAVQAVTEANNKVYLIKNYTTAGDWRSSVNAEEGSVVVPYSFTLTSTDPANVVLTLSGDYIFNIGTNSTIEPTIENIQINLATGTLGKFDGVHAIIDGEDTYIYGDKNTTYGLINSTSANTHIEIKNGKFQKNTGGYLVYATAGTVEISGGYFTDGAGGNTVRAHGTSEVTISGNTEFHITGATVPFNVAGTATLTVTNGKFYHAGSAQFAYINGSKNVYFNGGTFEYTATNDMFLLNKGAIEINGGTYTYDAATVSTSKYMFNVTAGTELTINGGEFTCKSGTDMFRILSLVTINGGTYTYDATTVDDEKYMFYVAADAELAINGGEFTNKSGTTMIRASGSVTIQGKAILTHNATADMIHTFGQLDIDGGEFYKKGNNNLINAKSGSTVNIYNGTFFKTGTHYIINTDGAKEAHVWGGTFTATGEAILFRSQDRASFTYVHGGTRKAGTLTRSDSNYRDYLIFMSDEAAADFGLVARIGEPADWANGYAASNYYMTLADAFTAVGAGGTVYDTTATGETSPVTLTIGDITADFVTDKSADGVATILSYVARIGDENYTFTNYYTTLAEAIAAAAADGTLTTVYLIDSFTSADKITIVAGQNILITSADATDPVAVTQNNSNAYLLTLSDGAKLTLRDVTFFTSGRLVLTNGGNAENTVLTLDDNATVRTTAEFATGGNGIFLIDEACTFVMMPTALITTADSSTTAECRVINVASTESASKFHIFGRILLEHTGTSSTATRVIYLNSNAADEVILYNGAFLSINMEETRLTHTTVFHVYVDSGVSPGIITIKHGARVYINKGAYAVSLYKTATLEMSGGTIIADGGTAAIFANNSTVSITGGSIICNNGTPAVKGSSNATFRITAEASITSDSLFEGSGIFADDMTATKFGFKVRLGAPEPEASGYASSNYKKTLTAAIAAVAAGGEEATLLTVLQSYTQNGAGITDDAANKKILVRGLDGVTITFDGMTTTVGEDEFSSVIYADGFDITFEHIGIDLSDSTLAILGDGASLTLGNGAVVNYAENVAVNVTGIAKLEGANATLTVDNGATVTINAFAKNNSNLLLGLHGANSELIFEDGSTLNVVYAQRSVIGILDASALLTINGGDFEIEAVQNYPCITTDYGGDIVINSGTFTLGNCNKNFIRARVLATINFNGGEFEITENFGNTFISCYGTVNITGGRFESKTDQIIFYVTEGENTAVAINISGGSFTHYGDGNIIQTGNGCKVNINNTDGNTEFVHEGAKYIVQSNASGVEIEQTSNENELSFTHRGNSYLICLNASSAPLTIKGGTFLHEGKGSSARLIQTSANSVTTISGGSFTHSGTGGYLICNNKANAVVNITGGEFHAENNITLLLASTEGATNNVGGTASFTHEGTGTIFAVWDGCATVISGGTGSHTGTGLLLTNVSGDEVKTGTITFTSDTAALGYGYAARVGAPENDDWTNGYSAFQYYSTFAEALQVALASDAAATDAGAFVFVLCNTDEITASFTISGKITIKNGNTSEINQINLNGSGYHFLPNNGTLILESIKVYTAGSFAQVQSGGTLTLAQGTTVYGPMNNAATRISVVENAQNAFLNVEQDAELRIDSGTAEKIYLIDVNGSVTGNLELLGTFVSETEAGGYMFTLGTMTSALEDTPAVLFNANAEYSGTGRVFQVGATTLHIAGGEIRNFGTGRMINSGGAYNITISGGTFIHYGNERLLLANQAGAVANITGGTFHHHSTSYGFQVNSATATLTFGAGVIAYAYDSSPLFQASNGTINVTGGSYTHMGTGHLINASSTATLSVSDAVTLTGDSIFNGTTTFADYTDAENSISITADETARALGFGARLGGTGNDTATSYASSVYYVTLVDALKAVTADDTNVLDITAADPTDITGAYNGFTVIIWTDDSATIGQIFGDKVAMIGSTTYTTLQEALDAITSADKVTIQLLKNIDLGTDTFDLSGKNVILLGYYGAKLPVTLSTTSDVASAYLFTGTGCSLELQHVIVEKNGCFASMDGSTLVIGEGATVTGLMTANSAAGYILLKNDTDLVIEENAAITMGKGTTLSVEAYLINTDTTWTGNIDVNGTIDVSTATQSAHYTICVPAGSAWAGVITVKGVITVTTTHTAGADCVIAVNADGTATGTINVSGKIYHTPTATSAAHRLITSQYAEVAVNVYEGAYLTSSPATTGSGCVITTMGNITITGGTLERTGSGGHVISLRGSKTASITGNTTLINNGGSATSYIFYRYASTGDVVIDGENVRLITAEKPSVVYASATNTSKTIIKNAYISTAKAIGTVNASYVVMENVRFDTDAIAATALAVCRVGSEAGKGYYTNFVTALTAAQATANAGSEVGEVLYLLCDLSYSSTAVISSKLTIASDPDNLKTLNVLNNGNHFEVQNGELILQNIKVYNDGRFAYIQSNGTLTLGNDVTIYGPMLYNGSRISLAANSTNLCVNITEGAVLRIDTTEEPTTIATRVFYVNPGCSGTIMIAGTVENYANTSKETRLLEHGNGTSSFDITISGTLMHAPTTSTNAYMFRLQGTITPYTENGGIQVCGDITHKAGNYMFDMAANVSITVTGGTLTCTESNSRMFQVNGNLTITGGTFVHEGTVQNEGTDDEIAAGYMFAVPGTITITGGSFTAHGARLLYFNYEAGVLNVSGGTFTQESEGQIFIFSKIQEANVTGGVYYAKNGAVVFSGAALPHEVTNAEFYLTTGAVLANSNTEVRIKNSILNVDADSSLGDPAFLYYYNVTIADDEMAARLLANFKADGTYYTRFDEAVSIAMSASADAAVVAVVRDGAKITRIEAPGIVITNGQALTINGNGHTATLNGANDLYLFTVEAGGTLTLSNVTIESCPTKFADVAGTLMLTDSTKLYAYTNTDVDEGVAPIAETSPLFNLHGEANVTLDAGSVIDFTYAEGDETHDAVDSQASIYIFHTASDWAGTLNIGGSVNHAWNVAGHSAIFYLESMSGSINVLTGASVTHNGEQAANENALLIAPAGGTTKFTIQPGATFSSLIMAIRSGDVDAQTTLTKKLLGYDYPEGASVTIIWGAMAFTYTAGEWNTDTLTYEQGTWAPDEEGGDQITVINTGLIEIEANFEYVAHDAYSSVEGAFKNGDDTAVTAPITVGAEESVTVTFTLDGKIHSLTLDDTKIGIITVTLTEGGN